MFGIANDELKPESVWNYEVSLKQNFLDRKLNFGINLYYIKGKNSIITAPVGDRWMWTNTGEIENYGIELEGRYNILSNLLVNGNYSYIHMKHDIEGTPHHKFYAGLDYNLERWMFSTGLQYIKGLVKLDDDENVLRESYVLWNLRVSYRAADWLNIFARGENLLAQKYEINYGFPMPRATVFGGVSFRF